jgi:hypothetical protein
MGKIEALYRYTISFIRTSENRKFFMEVVSTPKLAFGPNVPWRYTRSTQTTQVCCVQVLETRPGVAPRQKPMLIRQMTLEEVFKKAVSHSAAELVNPAPGPSSDAWLQPKYNSHHENDDDIDIPSSPGSSSKV